jgi:predicted DNA-binding transcriptional regulator AlpA
MHHESTPQYLRVSDIVTTRKKGHPAKPGILPISNATWWAWVKAKKAPPAIRLSPGVTVWEKAKVIAFAESMGQEAAQ